MAPKSKENVKVNLCLSKSIYYLTKHQAMEMYGGEELRGPTQKKIVK
jgi:hypothetical protein